MIGGALLLLSSAAHANESKSYDITDFSGVKASAGINVTFEQADSYSVIASFNGSADENDVKIRRDGDILKISYGNTSGKRNLKAKIAITAPQLDFAKATSGASLKIGRLTTDDIKLEASSGGSLRISGQCKDVVSKVSSGGSIQAKDLQCISARARASSGGSFSGYASEYGKGHSSSGGSIRIYGKPGEQEKNKSWSGGSVSFP
jgi:hypothetical protein